MKKRIKVMHIIESLDLGGAETVMGDIIKHMPGFVESDVCCLKRSGLLAQKIREYVGCIYELDKGEGNDPLIPIILSKLIKQNHVDILHAHNWNTFIESVLAAIIARKPVIHTIHGHLYLYPGTATGRLKKRVRHFGEKMLSFRSGKICTVSENIYDYIKNEIGIAEKHLEVIINGVDTDYTPRTPYPAISDQGIKPGDFLICFAGRLMPIKNIQSLLSAMEIIIQKCKTAKLIIIGEGPERSKLEKVAEEKGLGSSVVFTGFRNDVREIFAEADVFVLPSYFEGISIALLEAMAAGLPAVVSDVGGNSETVLHSQTGFLYPSGESKSLANYIIQLYNNPKLMRIIGEKARDRAKRFFSIKSVAWKYARIYNDLNR